jgi:hypothetical protein
MAYLRRIGSSAHYEERAIVVPDEAKDALITAVSDKTRNNLGKLCNVVRVLRDDCGVNFSE